MFYILRSLFLMATLSVLFAGDEKALREDILNDLAFQRVWTFLENKAVSYTHLTLPTICSV